ncbi:MAG TPA: hypothetical protein VJ888_03430 [Mobilitalea sp.]|nr:hypothetical protein [Mobilitalea sp.]
MITMYLCFLVGGAVLPFVSTLFGFFSDGVDTDVGADMDVDVDLDVDLDFDVDLNLDVDTGLDLDTGFDADADIDVGSGADMGNGADTGGFLSIGLFPSSLMSLSAMAITFGAVGAIRSYGEKGVIITLVIALIAGYVASVIVQSLIKTLRKVQKRNDCASENEIVLYDGKVIDTILPGQLGTVSFLTLNNILVSYPAKCKDEMLKLETGRIVKAIELKNGVIIIEPKNKYE